MKGAIVTSVLGFDGGELKKRSDISIHFNTLLGNYGVAEDTHLILCHYVSRKLQEMFN
jgi:D-sedoheptulose 7-phosphate isomerase